MSAGVEICVVGAGPAGSALATRLAELGHDVAIVDRQAFPRPHVGESLSPAIWPLLDALGVRDRVLEAGFTPTSVARVRWRDDEEERVDVPGGLTADRAAFDAILLQRACEAGARLLAPAHVRRPVRRRGGWELTLGDRVLRARFVADASGRRRLLGGGGCATAPRTLALHAIWRGGPPPDGTQTRIDVAAEGWLWGAWLPDGSFRAMVFVDPESVRAEGRDLPALYHRLVARSPLFAELTGCAAVAGPVRACDATSHAATACIDAVSVRVGEAAFAIDPLSSSGVQTAIQTGVAAAAAVHSILSPGGDRAAAIEYYTAHLRHSVDRHAATAAGLYAEHRTHAGEPFWRRRSGPMPERVPAPVPDRAPVTTSLAQLLTCRVGLHPDAALQATPCVVGDRVEMRRALAHPALDRPVAFLGGDELAPLLERLVDAAPLAEVIDRWDRALGTGRALAIANWLNARGLLVQTDAR